MNTARACAAHPDRPATAVLVHWGVQGNPLGAGLCGECAICQDCGAPATIMDREYEEFYCHRCAGQYSGEEAVHGPGIVAIDSEDYRRLEAKQ